MFDKRIALTTKDNPFDPINDFTSWFMYDTQMGYNTCSYLARICRTSEEFTDEENFEELEKAIDEIIENDFLKIYKKIKVE